ncbi:amino acid kinase family protein [Mesorhizobium sp. A623]
MRPVVVKLGGSTAGAPELGLWIAALAGSSLPLVIVPGGGPFADQVRDAQKRMGFSDKAAHAMAILAMEQLGHVLLDRHERLVPAQSMAEIEQALERKTIPVWLPSSMALSAADIPASWDITSDSLAAWLAGKIGAETLLLVKQSNAFTEHDTIDRLAANGIVDACFAAMLPAGVDFYLAGPRDAATASTRLGAGRLPGQKMAVRAMKKTG